MASGRWKQSALLHASEVENVHLALMLKQVLLDLEFDSDSELDDCALLDIVVNGDR
jgi:hypothetical protein